MAIPIISGYTSAVTSGGTSTIPINPQSNIVTGDLAQDDWIILIMSSASTSSGTNIPTAPGNWTNIVPFGTVGAGTMTFGMWAHQYSASETYSWSQTTGSVNTTNRRLVFVRGADDISKWVLGNFNFRQDTGTSLTNVAESITTTSADNLAIMVSSERTTAAETDSQVTCTNFTELIFDNVFDQTIIVATKTMSSAGATGSSTISYPNPHATNGIAGIIAIPAPFTLLSWPWLGFYQTIDYHLEDNLMGRWDFSGSLIDSSVNGNTGIAQGTLTSATDRKGNSSSAYTLSGSPNYMSTSVSFSDPTDYSINAWFKTTTTSGGVLVGFATSQTGTATNQDRFVWMNTSGKMNFGVWKSSATYVVSPNSYNDNGWHMVTAVMSASTGMSLYVDGALVGTNANKTSQSYTGYWRIGQSNTGSWPAGIGSYYSGAIDDVRTYNIALSTDQITALYNL